MTTAQKSTIRIILVRHGETEWNRLKRFQGRSDIVLNTTGKKQARALALALQHENITAIYTSPLKRAWETAHHIHRFHPSIPFLKEPGFMEMDLGDFEGLEAQQWRERYQEFRKAWMEKPSSLAMPGGESLLNVQRRSLDTLERISKSYLPGSTLLICSHNFVIVSLLCFASGRSLDQFRELKQDTAALNVLYKNGADFSVETVNDCRHLN